MTLLNIWLAMQACSAKLQIGRLINKYAQSSLIPRLLRGCAQSSVPKCLFGINLHLCDSITMSRHSSQRCDEKVINWLSQSFGVKHFMTKFSLAVYLLDEDVFHFFPKFMILKCNHI